MKRTIGKLVLSDEFQSSLAGPMLRGFVRATHRYVGYSPFFRLDTQAIERPNYAWCMLKAAELARRLGHDRISAIEFGVAGGNGLKFMCDFAREVKAAVGVDIDCYGFDSGSGMPPPEDLRDLPHWFQESQYAMDEAALRRKLPEAKLVIGNIRDTIDGFIDQYSPAPIGVIFNDTDYYSSTRDSFRLFDAVERRPECFLPRAFFYFDDVIGTEHEMYGEHNGQLAAIADYNRSQDKVRIALNQNLVNRPHLRWGRQIYYGHLLTHPRYDAYIGADAQPAIEQALRLR